MLTNFLFAESPATPDVPTLPAGTGQLAVNFKDGPTQISRSNFVEYKAIVIPELSQFVRTGALHLPSYNRLQYTWRRSDEWEQRNARPENKVFSETGEFLDNAQLTAGLLYGNSSVLQQTTDENELAKKILWNIISNRWSHATIETPFTLQWEKSGNFFRSMEGLFSRIYVRAINPEEKSIQLFREKISFSKPSPANLFAWLTFRFFGQEEDMFWLHSPVVNKTRQLTSTNRSDGLLGSAVSADDFFTWSGKAEELETKVERMTVALVPFPSIDMASLRVDENAACQIIDNTQTGGTDTVISNNTSTLRDPNMWLPNNSIFVPRNMWRIEMSSSDPYSLYGRQVLYVDTYMMLPVYKAVYNKSGRLWKIVMTAYGLAQSENRSLRVPYPAYTVVRDVLTGENFTLHYSRLQYCSKLPETMQLAQFDPKRLGPEQPQEAEQEQDKQQS